MRSITQSRCLIVRTTNGSLNLASGIVYQPIPVKTVSYQGSEIEMLTPQITGSVKNFGQKLRHIRDAQSIGHLPYLC